MRDMYGLIYPLRDINLLISSGDRPQDIGAVPHGCISSPFRSLSRPTHNGTDFAYYLTSPTTKAGNSGKPIFATQAGVVATASYQAGGAGNYVNINHSSAGFAVNTNYFHMKYIPSVRAGESVVQGQIIGYVGNTGNSFGDHLHFEVRPHGGDWIDPVFALGGAGEAPDDPGDPDSGRLHKKRMKLIFYMKNYF